MMKQSLKKYIEQNSHQYNISTGGRFYWDEQLLAKIVNQITPQRTCLIEPADNFLDVASELANQNTHCKFTLLLHQSSFGEQLIRRYFAIQPNVELHFYSPQLLTSNLGSFDTAIYSPIFNNNRPHYFSSHTTSVKNIHKICPFCYGQKSRTKPNTLKARIHSGLANLFPIGVWKHPCPCEFEKNENEP